MIAVNFLKRIEIFTNLTALCRRITLFSSTNIELNLEVYKQMLYNANSESDREITKKTKKMKMKRSARFSECRSYRYTLSRTWDMKLERILFIGLNPSTADDQCDDPTVRRCVGFAKRWGYGGLTLVNLFAYRTTDPKGLTEIENPIGPKNDYWISFEQNRAKRVVAAWGNHGMLLNRGEAVLETLSDVYCLGTTKSGCPLHPLYLAAKTPLREMNNKRSRLRVA